MLLITENNFCHANALFKYLIRTQA